MRQALSEKDAIALMVIALDKKRDILYRKRADFVLLKFLRHNAKALKAMDIENMADLWRSPPLPLRAKDMIKDHGYSDYQHWSLLKAWRKLGIDSIFMTMAEVKRTKPKKIHDICPDANFFLVWSRHCGYQVIHQNIWIKWKFSKQKTSAVTWHVIARSANSEKLVSKAIALEESESNHRSC